MLGYVWLFDIEQTNIDKHVNDEMQQDHINFIKKWFTQI